MAGRRTTKPTTEHPVDAESSSSESTSKINTEAERGALPFDPNPFMTRLSGKLYLEVKWRVVWFRDQNKNGHIKTELLSHERDTAVFKATVIADNGAIGSGHGSESAGDFRDYLEKAETKAIGRALATLGYGTADSLDEGQLAGSMQNAPKQSSSQRATSPQNRPNQGARSNTPSNPPAKQEGASIRSTGASTDASAKEKPQATQEEVEELARVWRVEIGPIVKKLGWTKDFEGGAEEFYEAVKQELERDWTWGDVTLAEAKKIRARVVYEWSEIQSKVAAEAQERGWKFNPDTDQVYDQDGVEVEGGFEQLALA